MWDAQRLFLLSEFARYGTVSAVAAHHHFSVSTVSQQLNKLEREVGMALFERDGRTLRLTATGELLVRHAHRVLELEDAVRAELDAARTQVSGVVRLASLETTANVLVGEALDALAEQYPHLRVEVSVTAPEAAIPDLASLQFDLVIAEEYPGHHRAKQPGIAHLPLGHDPLLLAVSPASDIDDLADAHATPFVVEPADTSAHQWVVAQCRTAGFEPDTQFISPNLHTHLRLVASGHAVSILPELMLATDSAPVRTIALPGAPARDLICMVRVGAARKPAITAVHRALQDALGASIRA